jgi:hypothetical protein
LFTSLARCSVFLLKFCRSWFPSRQLADLAPQLALIWFSPPLGSSVREPQHLCSPVLPFAAPVFRFLAVARWCGIDFPLGRIDRGLVSRLADMRSRLFVAEIFGSRLDFRCRQESSRFPLRSAPSFRFSGWRELGRCPIPFSPFVVSHRS